MWRVDLDAEAATSVGGGRFVLRAGAGPEARCAIAALRAIFGWLGRHLLIFALIVGALMLHAAWVSSRETALSDAAARQRTVEAGAAIAEVQDRARRAAEEMRVTASRSVESGTKTLVAQKGEATRQLHVLEAAAPSAFEQTRWAATANVGAMKGEALRRLEIERLKREIEFYSATIDLANDPNGAWAALRNAEAQLGQRSAVANQTCLAAGQAQKRLEAFRTQGNAIFRQFRRLFGEEGKLEREASAAQDACFAAIRDRDAALRNLAAAREAVRRGQVAIDTQIAVATGELEAVAAQAKSGGGARLSGYLWTAFWVLLGIIVAPFLIRAFLYAVVAPAAERRATIRIDLPDMQVPPVARTEASRISLPVVLGAGEELLIRDGYLQTSSQTARKATCWLLDPRHPLSSLASGLFFLTRISGEGEATTVSAVRDPFAELAEIELPAGAACVLHPRALVAVVQPEGAPMRITSHWRLLSLNAWLTLQLRFLAFHGPSRLIVRGTRGVRLEPAAKGRIFGQDQLIGFSADLAYSVARTETFWPYLLGRDSLFKDKVEAGGGLLVIEEAPLSSAKGRGGNKGLEGLLDAGLKVFGL